MQQGSTTSTLVLNDRPAKLAHHFTSARQQFEAAKLGMWLFLATEALLFGGLFCVYAVFRGNHPEIFAYGSQFLDTTWGAINTAVLILSSLTMALAVWCAQTNHGRELCLFLALTLLCAVDFLGIKYIEYSHKFHENLVWGMQFYQDAHAGVVQPETTAAHEPVVLQPGDADKGRNLYLRTCLSCHGLEGQGLPGLGRPLRTSEFVASLDDVGLVEFLKVGRPRNDPLNTTGAAMLPRGGNPTLTDQDLMDITAHLRVLQEQAVTTPQEEVATAVGAGLTVVSGELLIPKSVIPPAAVGPRGLASLPDETDEQEYSAKRAVLLGPRRDQNRPANAHLFFSIYFSMTGLHAVHVAGGMIVITWLLVRALKGHFSRGYFTPVDMGGLYWHIVDLIWIFLFPLFYLIR